MVLSPEGRERALNEIKKREEQTKLDMKDPNSPLGKITSRLLGTIQPQNNNQNSNNQWTNNLTNVAKTVQNGNNGYKKYNPNATNQQQQSASSNSPNTNPDRFVKYGYIDNRMAPQSNQQQTQQDIWGDHSVDTTDPNVQKLLSSWKEANGNSGNSEWLNKLVDAYKANQNQTGNNQTVNNVPSYGVRDNWNAQSVNNVANNQQQPVQNQSAVRASSSPNTTSSNSLNTPARVNIKAPEPSGETTSGATVGDSSQQSTTQDDFIKWSGPNNTVATFNPTMATTKAPNYTIKEGSYGTYDTGLGKQKDYATMVGSLGGKTDANGNYIDYLEQIAKGVEVPQGPSSNVTNAYSNLDDTLETMAGSSNIKAADDAGYREKNLQEGYTSDDLNKMAENGVGLLKDAYNTALNKAAANYNRLGLRGSGFEMADEFGNQSDSITSNYLKNVQQLQNDIDTKGLEAAREDRYKNADENEKNRQHWSEYDTKLKQDNFGNQGKLAELQQEFAKDQNASELDRNKQRTSAEQSNIDNIKDAVKLYEGALGQSHGQLIDWGNLNGGLAAKDWEAIKGIWETAIKNDQFTAEQKNEILKTILASIATGTAGSNENFNGMINQFAQYAPYIQEMMGAAGYPVQQS